MDGRNDVALRHVTDMDVRTKNALAAAAAAAMTGGAQREKAGMLALGVDQPDQAMNVNSVTGCGIK